MPPKFDPTAVVEVYVRATGIEPALVYNKKPRHTTVCF